MDDNTFIRIALFVPSISQNLSDFFQSFARENLKKRATEAGYGDVDEYVSDCEMKNPKYPARDYLECVNERGALNPLCKIYKEHWLELKAAQNGNKVACNEEEVHKMLKEDAVEAGYEEGYFVKKDPRYLKLTAREYEKCIAKHGVGAEKCKYDKQVWMEAKSFQNA